MSKTLYLLLFSVVIGWIACGENPKPTTQNETSKPVKEDIASNISITDTTFNAPDGLLISGRLYEKKGNQNYILYCHQATYNKAEYHEIAAKLLEKGYNGLAIDQRSGGTIPSYIVENKNETFQRAKSQQLSTQYLDAEQDIIAAIEYLSNTCNQKIILWGSSYSASLALKIGTNHPNVKAILAFSPGEYFRKQGVVIKPKIKELDKPTFVTSSNPEAEALNILISDLPKDLVTHFIPTVTGKHGSKALWASYEDHPTYWNAVNSFLNTF